MSSKASAQKDLFKRETLIHLDALLRTALYMTGDRTTADHLIQETFLRAFCLWGNISVPVSYRTRLFRAMTSLLNEYRRSQKLPSIYEMDEFKPGPMTVNGSLATMGSEEQDEICRNVGEEAVKKAIGRLPFDLRLILVLTIIEKFSYQEVAEITEMEIGAVKTRISEGRQLLQKIILRQIAEKGRAKKTSPLNESPWPSPVPGER